MINQAGNILDLQCDALGKTSDSILSMVGDRSESRRPARNGSVVSAGIRTSAMFAVLLLCVVAPGISQTAGSQTAESGSVEPALTSPSDPARDAWHGAMLNTPRPQETCSTATYPDQQWHEVPCEIAPSRAVVRDERVRPETVGGIGLDLTFVVANGIIEEGEGSFDKVTGVTSEESNGNPNSFSLQLNTNVFTTATCGSHKGCGGWVQFIYNSSAHTAFIQYWLENYGNSCPAGWTSDGEGDGGCYRNSSAVSTPAVTIAELHSMILFGHIGGYFGKPADDSVTIQIGDTFYAVDSGNPIEGAVNGWNQMEFNVFGDGDGSQAVFNSGSTIQVRDTMVLGTATNFGCTGYSTTSESNSLTVSATTPVVAAIGSPSLVFIESNVKGTSPGSCANAVVIGEHPIIPPVFGLH